MKTKTTAKPLYLHRLEVQNFMKVTALTVDVDGKHLVISGPNASGKTSSIDSIWAAVETKGRVIKDPIHHGADEALVRLDLGDYVLERRWSDAGSRLTLKHAGGGKVEDAGEVLKGFLGSYALNPVAFLRERPQDQKDSILEVSNITPPVDAVEAITGKREEPLLKESADSYLGRLSADKTGEYYKRRLDLGREVEVKRGAMADATEALEAIGGRLDPSEASAKDLFKQQDALEQAARARRTALDEAEDAKRLVERGEAELSRLTRDLDAEKAVVLDLQQRLAAALAKVEDLSGRMLKGRSQVDQLVAEAAASAEAAAKLVDPAPEIEKVRKQIQQVEARAKRKVASDTVDRLAVELTHAEALHKEKDDQLGALRALRVKILENVDVGVPGLKVTDGELQFNGVPFAQASQAEQIRVAAAVAMKQKPLLRLLRIDDGEHMDKKSRQYLLELAAAQGFQVIMTLVADQDDLSIDLIDWQTEAA